MDPDNASAVYDAYGMQDAGTNDGANGADELPPDMVLHKARCFSAWMIPSLQKGSRAGERK